MTANLKKLIFTILWRWVYNDLQYYNNKYKDMKECIGEGSKKRTQKKNKYTKHIYTYIYIYIYKLKINRLVKPPSKTGMPTVLQDLETSQTAPKSERSYSIGTKQSIRGGAWTGVVKWGRNIWKLRSLANIRQGSSETRVPKNCGWEDLGN